MFMLRSNPASHFPNRLIVSRIEVGLLLSAFANVFFAAGEFYRGTPPIALLWVRAVTLAVIAVLILLLRQPWAERRARVMGFVAAAFICSVAAAVGIISREPHAPFLAVVTLLMGSAALVPCSTCIQTYVAAMTAATIFATEALFPGSFFHLGIEKQWVEILVVAIISIAISHQLGRHRERLELILQSTGEGIYGTDRKGHCIFINAAALQILGYDTSEEVLGQNMHARVHNSDTDGKRYPVERCPIYEVLRTGRSCRFDHEVFWRKDGTCFPVEYSSYPIIEDGIVRGAVVSFADITVRQEAERTRSDLVAMLSHDIKNPLNVVLGFTELLRNELPETPGETRKMLDEIEVSARKALGLAVNFVDASRAESRALRIDPTEGALNDVVQRALRDQRAAARARGVTFETDLASNLPQIPLDESMFDRVVGNLVGNAVRYTPKGGTVKVRTAALGDEVLLYVADQGPGVPLEDRPKLFRRFSQVGHTVKNSSGLGLFIVKTIVEAHGGRVSLECPPEGGSTFVVALPIAPRISSATEPAHQLGAVVPIPALTSPVGESTPIGATGRQEPRIADTREEVYRAAGVADDVSDLKRMQAENARLAAVVESATDAIFAFSRDRTITSWNRSAERLFGYPEAEVIGKSGKILLPKDGNDYEAIFDRVMSGEAVENYRTRRVTKEGRVTDVSVTESPILDDSGHVQGVSVVARDVSEQTRMEEELRILSAAVSAAANAIVIADLEAQIVFVNPAFTRLTGYAQTDVIGQRTRLLKSGVQDSSFYEHLWKTILSGRVWSGEMTNRRKDGTLYPEEMTITPVRRDGVITHFIAIKSDIAERKKTEEQLCHALAKANESDRLKTAFLANMSHEVRTPLNIILGYNSLIAERLSELHDETVAAELKAVSDASERLLDTVQGIVDLSRIETGTFEIRPGPVKLALLLDEAVRPCREVAAGKGLSIDCGTEVGDVEIRIDEYCLTQSLRRLLNNAIKFTKQGRITVRLYREPSGVLSLSVCDTGVGIAEGYLPHLFAPFSQEDGGYTRQFDGPGIGLALTKRYLEMNRTEITVDTKSGVGTTFTLHFPPSAEKLGVDVPMGAFQ